ncbi:MAG: tautomerase family protein [Christensenellales bacterium]|jgi:phenylpyruvate tautomerase PptA (4-oxalocrotonate tautomerase family)
MPYVRLCTSKHLSTDKIDAVRKIVGDTISLIPGKSFEVTTIHIEPDSLISRGDPSNPSLFIEVRLFGPSSTGSKKEFAKQICTSLESALDIPQKFISINILELDGWGGNGGYNTFR